MGTEPEDQTPVLTRGHLLAAAVAVSVVVLCAAALLAVRGCRADQLARQGARQLAEAEAALQAAGVSTDRPAELAGNPGGLLIEAASLVARSVELAAEEESLARIRAYFAWGHVDPGADEPGPAALPPERPEHAVLRELLRQLGDLEEPEFPVHYPPEGVPLAEPHVLDHANALSRSCEHFAMADALDGRLAEAFGWPVTMLKIGRAYGDLGGVTVTAWRCRWMFGALAVDLAEKLVASGEVPDGVLATVQAALAAEQRNWSLRDEAAQCALGEFDAARAVPRSLWLEGVLWHRGQPGTLPFGFSMEELTEPEVGRLRYVRECRRWLELCEAASAPMHETVARVRSRASTARGVGASPAEEWDSPASFWRSARSNTLGMAERVARLRAGAVGLPAERHRLARGTWPGSVDELAPLLAPGVAEDPFTGLPLLLRPSAGDLLVYSVGPDDVDDGGTMSPKGGRGGDIVLRLRDPSMRGASGLTRSQRSEAPAEARQE
jgi:hypothetical protein